MNDGGWKLGRRPALDGVRGVAILLVVGAHADFPLMRRGGLVGVTVFFVLSGFLITALLVEEHRKYGRVDLKAFYVRRALRLLPAIVVVTAVVTAVALLFGDTPASTVARDGFGSLFYFGNWLRAAGEGMGYLGHTWSLAIEEQFYLVWPLLFIGALALDKGRTRLILAIAAVGTVASMLARVVLWNGPESVDRIYFGSDTRADAILAGCVLALIVTAGVKLPSSRWLLVPAAVVLGAVTIDLVPLSLLYRVALAAIAAASVALVLVLLKHPGELWGVFEWSPMVRVGRLSYGLYLWHLPILALRKAVPDVPRLPATLALLGFAWLVTEVSYRALESPFLRMKKRFGKPSPELVQDTVAS